jgi:hypothetical protein
MAGPSPDLAHERRPSRRSPASRGTATAEPIIRPSPWLRSCVVGGRPSPGGHSLLDVRSERRVDPTASRRRPEVRGGAASGDRRGRLSGHGRRSSPGGHLAVPRVGTQRGETSRGAARLRRICHPPVLRVGLAPCRPVVRILAPAGIGAPPALSATARQWPDSRPRTVRHG